MHLSEHFGSLSGISTMSLTFLLVLEAVLEAVLEVVEDHPCMMYFL